MKREVIGGSKHGLPQPTPFERGARQDRQALTDAAQGLEAVDLACADVAGGRVSLERLSVGP
jgi:hypothetical protein